MTALSEILTITLGESPAPRLDKALAAFVPEGVTLSRSRLRVLIESGQVSHSGRIVTEIKAKVAPFQEWQVVLPVAVELDAQPEDIPIDVVFEDAHLIVVNKPAGMVVHPAPGSETGTLVNALLHHCGDTLSGIGGKKRPGIVHRIDKDTSGLLVVAKSDAAHQGLAAQFAAHDLERLYRAVVWGRPSAMDPRLAGINGVRFEKGNVVRISGNIARHRTDRKRMAVVKDAGRHAITRARCDEAFGPSERPVASLVSCWLETGRTHQIRAHMSYVGHALIGDPVYGSRRAIPKKALSDVGVEALRGFARQALHAGVLGFVHPVTGAELRFEAPLPADFEALLTAIRN
ncbi:MAG: RluA family pseudouridine synthase [Rhodobacteraceae bacterium]|nr:RluA family pseudouridine synthase [Paracoccaceae bacterium]